MLRGVLGGIWGFLLDFWASASGFAHEEWGGKYACCAQKSSKNPQIPNFSWKSKVEQKVGFLL